MCSNSFFSPEEVDFVAPVIILLFYLIIFSSIHMQIPPYLNFFFMKLELQNGLEKMKDNVPAETTTCAVLLPLIVWLSACAHSVPTVSTYFLLVYRGLVW